MSIPHKTFVNACLNAVATMRELAPKDTMNLAYNAIKVEFRDNGTCVIHVDLGIAKYMPFTTLPWTSPKWNGKKNPNEGWWENAAAVVLKQIANELKGEVNDVTNK